MVVWLDMVFEGRLVGVVGAVPTGPVLPGPVVVEPVVSEVAEVVVAEVVTVAEVVVVAAVVVARLEELVELLAIVVLLTKWNGPVLVAEEQKLMKGAKNCSMLGCRVALVVAPFAAAQSLHSVTSLVKTDSEHSIRERPTLCASLKAELHWAKQTAGIMLSSTRFSIVTRSTIFRFSAAGVGRGKCVIEACDVQSPVV